MTNWPQRNYNLLFAFFSAVIGMVLFGGMISGQLFFWLDRLPQGDIGLFRSPTEAQILNVQLVEEVTAVTLLEAGDYRIISNNPGLRAGNLSVRSTTTNKEVPSTVIDRTRYEPYDTELLQGAQLIDVQIEEGGSYQIVVSKIDASLVKPIITIFPDYTEQNRLRIIGSSLVLLLVAGFFWYRSNRPLVPKEQKVQKRERWSEFMEENEQAKTH